LLLTIDKTTILCYYYLFNPQSRGLNVARQSRKGTPEKGLENRRSAMNISKSDELELGGQNLNKMKQRIVGQVGMIVGFLTECPADVAMMLSMKTESTDRFVRLSGGFVWYLPTTVNHNRTNASERLWMIRCYPDYEQGQAPKFQWEVEFKLVRDSFVIASYNRHFGSRSDTVLHNTSIQGVFEALDDFLEGMEREFEFLKTCLAPIRRAAQVKI
jgi:hypothetical protein